MSTLIASVFVKPATAAETVYIRADGSVDPPTAPINVYGNVYTLTSNINDSIVIEKDNIVIDGAGFTLQGPGGIFGTTAISLNGRSNVTIENMRVTGFYRGIFLTASSSNNIYGNEIIGSPSEGVRLYQSSNYNSVFGNNITDNYNGITLSYSSNNPISGNKITGSLSNGVSLSSSDYNNFSENEIASGNDGISLMNSNYNDFSGNDIDGGADGITLSNSSSNMISRNGITSNLHGIWIGATSNNCTVSGNGIESRLRAGVGLADSNECNISGNNITGSAWEGLWLINSSSNIISVNNITSNHEDGIELDYSFSNMIYGNKIAANWLHGILLSNSSSNTVYENNITSNGHGLLAGDCSGILVDSSNDNTLSGNQITANDYGIMIQSSSNNTLRNNDASNNKYNFGIYSSSLTHCIQDIDDSNTVNGKPVYYWVNRQGMIVPHDAGYVALVNCTNMIVQNLKIDNNWQGVLLAHTTNSSIAKNDVTNNEWGIELDYSSNNNNVFENNVTNNLDGIWLYQSSSNNEIYGNDILNNDYGIRLSESSNNTLYGNDIKNNYCGIWLNWSLSNIFYHNNFVDNTEQVYSLNSTNVWDDVYYAVGNYWSDYIGIDSDGDGLGDTPYVIDSSNQDSYPLMSTFQEEYLLTVNVVGSGSVSLNNTGPYHIGDVVSLTANPNAGWSFTAWSGALTGSANPAQITIIGDLFVTATFTQNTQSNNGQGTSEPEVTKADITKPVANAGPDKLVVEDGVVSFDAGGSSDNVGIVSYEWDFGDNAIGTGRTVNHTYNESGIYTVTLTVKDAAGNSITDSITVTVQKDTDGDGDPDVTDTDDDNDGMSDAWETDNELDPLDATDATLDSDHDGLTNLQEYQQEKNPNFPDGDTQAQSLYVVAAAIGAFAAATMVIMGTRSGLGNAFDSAISKLPIPESVRDFIQLYGEKLFETVDKAKLDTLEKAPFITNGEIVALAASALMAMIVFGSAEAKGLQNFLNPSELAIVVPSALISVFVVIVIGELFEALCARTCNIYRRFKLWMYGTIVFLVSGLLFQLPFGSPGITRYQNGEISKKKKGLLVLSKMLLLLTLALPFAGLSMLGFDYAGSLGLKFTLMTVFFSLLPVRPLVGKAIFDYRKEISLTALLGAGILFFSNASSLFPNVAFLAAGVISIPLAGIALYQLRKEKPK